MNFSICDKCKGFDYKKISQLLKKQYPDAKINLGCNNSCGVGRDNIVVICNDNLIVSNKTKELLEKIDKLNNN